MSWFYIEISNIGYPLRELSEVQCGRRVKFNLDVSVNIKV
jgi:hypothetical protein